MCVCVSLRVRSVVELGHGRGSQLRRVCSETQWNESGTKRLDGGAGKRFPAVGSRDSLEIQLQLVRQFLSFFFPLCPLLDWSEKTGY